MTTLTTISTAELTSAVLPIYGFHAPTRSWVTQAGPEADPLPRLSGQLLTDPLSLKAVSDDFGHIVHRMPLAVLRPASVHDVCQMVRFARKHRMRVVSRGHGHTAFGQAQVEAGLVIDMRSLSQIHQIGVDRAVVDAGVSWRDLLHATAAQGLTPPVLTDYIALTVGGTLSVAGVSGRSFQYGMQVDNVLELDVVTGEGKQVTCSATKHQALFRAALGGLGLCAIIVRATLRLIPAQKMARTNRLFYADVPTLLADLRRLVEQNAFDCLHGMVAPPPTPDGTPATTFACFIEAVDFYDSPDELPQSLPGGLHHVPGLVQVEDRTYLAFSDQVLDLMTALAAAGLGSFPHPWLDLFLPDAVVDDFAAQTIAALNPADFLPGSLLLFYPFVRSKLTPSSVRVPDGDLFFLFDILQTVPPNPDVVQAVLMRNRQLYDQSRALGGYVYTISAVEMRPADWAAHFGPAYKTVMNAKRRYDPDEVLGGVKLSGKPNAAR